jgi:prepilin-type N-terminal cleavage/methylation domain-containing protein
MGAALPAWHPLCSRWSHETENIVSYPMNQKGFTLIELIAVIIIIGAIGAVAAPKFLSLTEAAADKAAGQALSEGKARLTNQYAIHLMNSDADPYNLAAIIASVNTDAGDYRLEFVVAGSEVKITAIGNQERGVSGRAEGRWKIL